jgi:hypothetical protein
MTLRADHVTGALAIAFGLVVLALSGDLPVGTLAFPGAGFMPKLVTILMMLLGAALILRGTDSPPLATLDFADLRHAGGVALVVAAAAALYLRVGFIMTMAVMLFVLSAGLERRNPVHAALFSLGVTLLTYGLFKLVLRTPLAAGPFGF